MVEEPAGHVQQEARLAPVARGEGRKWILDVAGGLRWIDKDKVHARGIELVAQRRKAVKQLEPAPACRPNAHGNEPALAARIAQAYPLAFMRQQWNIHVYHAPLPGFARHPARRATGPVKV
ncbi:hypothetical protein ACFSHT_29590 [Paraburkholderia silviterrae]|uniref:Uncharacterized protein n=1 Tax=Paraburkholderia silviterrae TaxID=2528715 RepID=A0A4R5M7J8_9BURK|nr:hypothetical protein [Paraburkholderia silviterrae]TDG22126.1 hypothetical protein EYW47_19805 [Paraburkholderia silviterrae]